MEVTESDGRARVVAVAREWLGTPHHHRARVKGAGVDCGQLVAGVFEEAGLIPPVELENYPRDWMLHRDEPRFQNTVERYAEPIQGRTPIPGDIILYKFGRSLSHGGIVEDWPFVIHAVAQQGVIRTNMDAEPALMKRAAGFWRFKGWT